MVSVPEYAVAVPTAANHEHNYKNLNLYNGEWVKVSVPESAAAAAPKKAGLDSVHTAEVSWIFPVRVRNTLQK